MNRRRFLRTAGSSGALGLLALGSPALAAPAGAGGRFRTYALATSGKAFLPVERHVAAACPDTTLRVCLQALHVAPGEPVLRRFRLSALFDVPGAAQSPFHVWHYDAEDPSRTTRGFAFIAGRATMRGFHVDYRLDPQIGGTLACDERCSAVASALAPLQPGRYVLAGPRRHGRAVDAARLPFSGEAARPLHDTGRDFDYLAFAITPGTTA